MVLFLLFLHKIGYRSGAKIYSQNGEEVLNIYLASTYAVSAILSSDNKTLYIGEVDFNGINAKSNIKVIDVSTNSSKIIKMDNDVIITGIEYVDAENVYIQTNEAIYCLDSRNELSKLYEYNIKNTVYSVVENSKMPVIVEKNDNILRVVSSKDNRYLELNEEPQIVDALANKIALYFENEIWIINSECRILKKCNPDNGLLDLKLMNDGKIMVLIFNDKVELVKI